MKQQAKSKKQQEKNKKQQVKKKENSLKLNSTEKALLKVKIREEILETQYLKKITIKQIKKEEHLSLLLNERIRAFDNYISRLESILRKEKL